MMLVMMSVDITVVIAASAGSDMTVECRCVSHITWINKNIEVQKHKTFAQYIL